MLDYLKTHPKLTVVLADQDLGVAGAYDAREQLVKKHSSTFFAVGGYYACDSRLVLPMKARVQGLVDRNVEVYARKALEAALDLMDGKSVPDRVLVDVRYYPNPQPFLPTSAEESAEKGRRRPPALSCGNRVREPFPGPLREPLRGGSNELQSGTIPPLSRPTSGCALARNA